LVFWYDITTPAARQLTTICWISFQTADIGTWDKYAALGQWTKNYHATNTGAWVTSNAPLPGAVWLLGSGLIGIVGIRRKIKQ